MDTRFFTAWIEEIARVVAAGRDHLTELDAAIGDADHGANLDRGFTAVREALAAKPPATPGAVLTLTGTTLIRKVGGASGPLYGTAFRQMGMALSPGPSATSDAGPKPAPGARSASEAGSDAAPATGPASYAGSSAALPTDSASYAGSGAIPITGSDSYAVPATGSASAAGPGAAAEVTLAELAVALEAALAGVRKLGGAAEGDKTMIDALAPATRALADAVREGLEPERALDAARTAAEEGALATVPLMARKGRASYLGERSVGHQDPGATSTALIFGALRTVAAG